MLPLGDDREPGGPAAIVTLALIALNVVAFLLELSRPGRGAPVLHPGVGRRAARVLGGRATSRRSSRCRSGRRSFTSMFLHGGWMHLGGNMLYLWIFGDNIEQRLGHVKFLIFYLVCGLAASVAHILFNPQLPVPAVGASGAISGVLGGYLLLFPKNRVRVLTRGGIAAVPAIVVLGFWIVLQFINGIGSIARRPKTAGWPTWRTSAGSSQGSCSSPSMGGCCCWLSRERGLVRPVHECEPLHSSRATS